MLAFRVKLETSFSFAVIRLFFFFSSPTLRVIAKGMIVCRAWDCPLGHRYFSALLRLTGQVTANFISLAFGFRHSHLGITSHLESLLGKLSILL